MKPTHRLARYLVADVRRTYPSDSRIRGERGYTEQEIVIATLLANGYAPEDIGTALGISPFTVAHHIKWLFRKTRVSKREACIATMIRGGNIRREWILDLPAIYRRAEEHVWN